MKHVEDWRTDFDHLEWRWVEDPQAIWADLRLTCPHFSQDSVMRVDAASCVSF